MIITAVGNEAEAPAIDSVELSVTSIVPGDVVTVTVTGNEALTGVRLTIVKPDGSSFPTRDVTGLSINLDEFDESAIPGTYNVGLYRTGRGWSDRQYRQQNA